MDDWQSAESGQFLTFLPNPHLAPIMTPISEDDLLHKMEQSLNNISFDELNKLCEQHFGQPRQKGSHLVFRTPWPGDPRINIQSDKGKAKPYQVRQVIAAIKKMRENI